MKPVVTTTLTALITIVLLHIDDVAGFAPSVPKTRQLLLPLKMVEQKQKEHDWLSGVRDWFASMTETTDMTDEQVETKQKDDWVAKELNSERSVGDDDWETEVLTNDDDDIEAIEMAGKVETVEAEPVVTKAKVDPATTRQDTIKKAKFAVVDQDAQTITESKDAWIARDMVKAGKDDVKDWVADDMEKTGKVEPIQQSSDWIASDMREAGKAAAEHPKKKDDAKKKSKSKTELIKKDMEAAGKMTGDDWVARDMATAGKSVEEVQPTSWMTKLGQKLDKSRETRYDDIYDDMEKAGKDTHSNDWIAQDMAQAGRAEAPMAKLTSIGKDKNASYDIDKMLKKAFNVDEIRKDMEEAGHAEASDWIARDLEETGRNHSSVMGRAYPAPKKEISNWLSKEKNDWIAKDMKNEGRGTSSRRTENKLSQQKLNDMLAEDMTRMGKTSMDNGQVFRDMELAGHPDAHLNKQSDGAFVSHQKRETDEFMSTRKVKMAPSKQEIPLVDDGPIVILTHDETHNEHTMEQDKEHAMMSTRKVKMAPSKQEVPLVDDGPVGTLTDGETQNEHDEEHDEEHDMEHHRVRDFVKRAAKKAVHPFTKWKDL